METRFKARIDSFERFGIIGAEDCLLLRYPATAKGRIDKLIKKVAEKQARNAEKGLQDVEVDVSIEIDFEGRSLSANALMWSLYGIQAYYLNQELKQVQQVTAEELYENDMADYAPRHKIKCPKESKEFFRHILTKEKGKIKKEKEIDGYVYFEVWETSSFWNTKRMAEFIDLKIYELEQAGITMAENGNLEKIFNDFKKWKKQQEEKDESKIDTE